MHFLFLVGVSDRLCITAARSRRLIRNHLFSAKWHVGELMKNPELKCATASCRSDALEPSTAREMKALHHDKHGAKAHTPNQAHTPNPSCQSAHDYLPSVDLLHPI